MPPFGQSSTHIEKEIPHEPVSDEAEYGSDPEQHGEAAEQLLAELDPFRRLFRRRQSV